MKKCIAILLSIVISLSMMPAALAAPMRDIATETTLAGGLKDLGLFMGRGQQSDGSSDFDLEGKPNRVEAVAMLLRTLGKGTEAEKHAKTHPFTDVPAWADGYVSYAYEKGLVKGVTAGRFESQQTATADVYLTFMLRALGYSEETHEDFTWNSPYALAAWCGILPIQVDKNEFLRADVVNVTCAALFANHKGTETKLYETLISDGLFTEEEFQAVFPENPFARFYQIDQKVTQALAQNFQLGRLGDDISYSQFGFECHVITDMTEREGVLKLTVWVCYSRATINQKNEYLSGGSSIAPWQVELDANTLEILSCSAPRTRFTESEVREQGMLREGMWCLCDRKGKSQHEQGIIGYQKLSYEQAMAKIKDSLENVQTLETDLFTAVVGKEQGEEACSLYLVFKAGSEKGEGTMIHEVFPASEVFDFCVSEDGMQVQCSYHCENASYDIAWTQSQEKPEKLTLVTTIDLDKGCTSTGVHAD